MLLAREDEGFEVAGAVSAKVASYRYGGLLPNTTYCMVIEAVYVDGIGSALSLSARTLPYTEFTMGTF